MSRLRPGLFGGNAAAMGGSPPPPPAPTVFGTPVTIGVSVFVTFSEAVSLLDTGWSIRVNAGAPSGLTYASGDGTANVVFTTVALISAGNTVTYSYDDATGDTENASHVPLASITDQPVTNLN